MRPFTTLTSRFVPLPRKDVDTDLIYPAQYLTNVSRDGHGRILFKNLREGDLTFPLNDPRARDARILVAGENFGCGSSREHAVWALQGAGFDVVVAKSFADIFASNAANNGLLLVVLPGPDVDMLLADGFDMEIAVDLARQEVSMPDGRRVPFAYDSFRKHCLLNGYDVLDYLISHRDAIDAYHARRAHYPPPRLGER